MSESAPRLLAYILRRVLPISVAMVLLISLGVALLARGALVGEKRQRLEALADERVHLIAHYLRGARQSLEALSHEPRLLEALERRGEMAPYLELLFGTFGPKQMGGWLSLLAADGRQIAGNGPAVPSSAAVWVSELMQTGRSQWRIRTSGGLLIAAPIQRDGVNLGVLVLECEVNLLQQSIAHDELEHFQWMVVDPARRLVFSPIQAGGPAATDLHLDESHFWVSRELPGFPGLTFVGAMQKDQALQPLRLFYAIMLIILLLNLMALTGGIYLAGESVTHPLAAIVDQIQAAGEIHSLEEPIQTSGPLELQQLTDSFNQLTGRLLLSERRLGESRHQMELILEAAGEGIFVLGQDGQTTFVNPAGLRMLGFEAEELIGRPQHAIMHHTRADGRPYPMEECPIRRTLVTGEATHVEGELFWRKDGSSFQVEYFCTPIQELGEVVGAVVVFKDVTERRLAQLALLESERKFSVIAESAHEAIVMMDDQGSVVYWNTAAGRVTGYSSQEALGQKIHDLLIPEPHRQAHMEALADFARTGMGPVLGHMMEMVAMDKQGNELPIELSISAVMLNGRWHAVGIFRDISQRKQFEAMLRNSRNSYQTLVDNLPERVLYKNTDFVYVSCNRRFAESMGLKPAQIPGMTDFDLFPRDVAERQRAVDKRVIASRRMEEYEEVISEESGTSYMHVIKTPLQNDEGQVIGVLGIQWDISSLKRAEQARQTMEIQLRQAHKLEAVGQLAAGIAHEINTPTQYVSDNTRFLQEAFADYNRLLQRYRELLADPTSQGETAQQLEQEIDLDYLSQEIPQAIEQSLEGLARITRIVQAMKEFSHPGSRDMVATDLNKAIETTIEVSRNEWKYVAELVTQFDPQLPRVSVLVSEFNQAILNMIVNAAHAIAEVVGQSGDKGTITIRTAALGEWIEIRIKDTGCGIPQEIQKRIFDPFFTTKEVGKGSGQGLSMVWAIIVEKHKGTIEVESVPGAGAEFIVRLPMERDEA